MGKGRLLHWLLILMHLWCFCFSLSEVFEGAEDMCIDIPKIWDYLGEVLCPVFAHEYMPLSVFKKSPSSLVRVG